MIFCQILSCDYQRVTIYNPQIFKKSKSQKVHVGTHVLIFVWGRAVPVVLIQVLHFWIFWIKMGRRVYFLKMSLLHFIIKYFYFWLEAQMKLFVW